MFGKITDIGNILLAHRKARKDKPQYKEAQRVNKNPMQYATLIKSMLEDESDAVR